MKIIKDIESTIDIRFHLWEISRLVIMLQNSSKAKVDEDMLKKLKKVLEVFEV
jgi:hypothetical protein